MVTPRVVHKLKKQETTKIKGMKKSEKAKGKERAAAKKKQTLMYVAGAVGGVIVVAVALFFILNTAVVKTGDSVSVFYVGTLDNGSVFDSNVDKAALNFTVGEHKVIPGFENAVIGMSKDQVKTVKIPFIEAYGPYRDELVTSVSRELFAGKTPPEIGMYYSMTNPETGSLSYAKVINVSKDTVTIDQNHMLAGQNLTFMIRIAGIAPGKMVANTTVT